MAALGRPRSAIGRITLAGALAGTACGFAFAILASLAWPLVTGGKPIVSLPPFAIIAFEVTVLFGATTNLFAVMIAGKRGRRRRDVPFDARFSADRIGLFVAGCESASVRPLLIASGAEEVRDVA